MGERFRWGRWEAIWESAWSRRRAKWPGGGREDGEPPDAFALELTALMSKARTFLQGAWPLGLKERPAQRVIQRSARAFYLAGKWGGNDAGAWGHITCTSPCAAESAGAAKER